MMADDFATILRRLLPFGKAWQIKFDTNYDKLIEATSKEYNRLQAFINEVRDQAIPDTSTDLLEEWADIYRIDPLKTDDEKKALATQYYTEKGNQSPDYLATQLSTAGYDLELEEFQGGESQVGMAEVGEPLECGSSGSYFAAIGDVEDNETEINNIIEYYKPTQVPHWLVHSVGGIWQMGQLTGKQDYLYILGASATDFDPASNNNDFTAIIEYIPCNYDSGLTLQGVFTKWQTGTDDRSWALYHNTTALKVAISKDGTFNPGSYTDLSWGVSVSLSNQRQFVGLRYKYVADGTSILDLWFNAGKVATSSTAVGPIHSSSSAPVQINAYSGASNYHSGYYDKYAYFNRTLTDQEMTDLLNQVVEYKDLAPDSYDDFSSDRAATMTAKIGGHVWTVSGLPYTSQDDPYSDWWIFNGSSNRFEAYAIGCGTGSQDILPNLTQNSGQNDFTFAIGLKYNRAAGYGSFENFWADDRNQDLWDIYINNLDELKMNRPTLGPSNQLVSISDARNKMNGKDCLIVCTFVAGSTTSDSVLKIHLVTEDGTFTDTKSDCDYRFPSGTPGPVDLGGHFGGADAAFNSYWYFYNFGRALTDQDVADLWAQDKHPVQFTPNAYYDFRNSPVNPFQFAIRNIQSAEIYRICGGATLPTKNP